MRSDDILIVDDEVGIREVLQETLEDEGYTVALAENAAEARRLRNQTRPAMVLLDIWMPDSDGITLLKEWAKNGQLTMPVVMMSGHGTIDTAVEATKIGALDFLEKPIPLQKLLATVERALKYGASQANSDLSFSNLGKSQLIQDLNRQLAKAARQKLPVLLLGETGSPFEMLAHTFLKDNKPWVEPSKSEHILDMPIELLNKATGGVLYLGDLAQYNNKIRQGVGFILSKAERHNTRVVCTSSRPVQELLAESGQDTKLLPLLSSLTIQIPPLRHHAEDIVFLVGQITAELANNHQAPPVKFTNAALTRLRQYEWPGNWEQLKNVVKSLALNAVNREINDGAVTRMLNQFDQSSNSEIKGGFNFNLPLRELREELERRYFEYHIQQENHNMSRVAIKVGLERTHLYRKLKQLGINFTRNRDKE